MADALVHRGPDDCGEWIDVSAGIALGFRRLSIIDLSPAGHQPMHSASGRFVIAYNGEVYNFEAIRRELSRQHAALEFRGHSDTEVILAAIETWGLTTAVQKFVGMFAFAVWDRLEKRLHLVRDRIGVKPLYYGWCEETFLFGSELKALRQHSDFDADIDRSAIALLLRHNYIGNPYTIYKGLWKLMPGTILTISAAERDPRLQAYWSAREAAERSITEPFRGTPEEATEELDALLRDSVRLRMIADVPLGVFLSGGIDSSTVVSMMQIQSSRPVKTFTIGFHEEAYDEARHAKAVAQHLGTDHTELYVTPQEALAVIPKLPEIYDEPFADSSQIPTFLVSALARQRVTVSLSGDGGDELFGGYNRYVWTGRIWHALGWFPTKVRNLMARALVAIPPHRWENVFRFGDRFLPSALKLRLPGQKVHRLAEVLQAAEPHEMYRIVASHWRAPEDIVIGSSTLATTLNSAEQWPDLPSFLQQMMYLDLVTYLPDDLLVKVDRASMAVSLEAREPLLDHRLVEFALRLPTSLKIRNGEGKWILRQVLQKYVPARILDRPKMGFGLPLDSWLRGPLRDWAESLLSERRLRQEGFFETSQIRQKWNEHLSGRHNWQYHLWDVLMFQAWYEHQKRSMTVNGDNAVVQLQSVR